MKKVCIKLLSIVALLVISCEVNDNVLDIPQDIEGDLEVLRNSSSKNKDDSNDFIFVFSTTDKKLNIKMEGFLIKKELHSILSFKERNSDWIKLTEFKYSIAEVDYKERMNKKVEDYAQGIKDNQPVRVINELESILDVMPELLYKELGEDSYFSETVLSFFYHLGVFKTAKRAIIKNSDECHCESFVSYLNDESPFFCSEDKVVSVDEAYALIEDLSKRRKFANKEFNPQQTLNFLKNRRGQVLSVSNIDNLFTGEFRLFWKNELTEKDKSKIYSENYNSDDIASRVIDDDEWPYDPECLIYGTNVGSDCGCCGNYSGACYLCSLACYIHDNTCEDCTPSWYCFSGCVPGEC